MSEPDNILAMLHDSASRSLAEQSTKEVVNAAEAGIWPTALWQTVEDQGLTRAAVSEEADGSNLPLADALTLARQAARYAAPVPLGETIVAGWLLSQAALPVPTGPLTFGPVDRRPPPTLTRQGDGWLLNGSAHGLPWGDRCEAVVLVLEVASVAHVVSLSPGQGSATPGRNLAGEPRTKLNFDSTPLAASQVAPLSDTLGLPAADLVRVLGALLRAQQMAGALEYARDLSVRYTSERIAFGKPLNKLQAVQQNLAVLAGQTAAARVAADMALDALRAAADAPSPSHGATLLGAAGLSKARAGEAAGIGAQLAHQAHGAIGTTYEHMLHHATRRLWSWRDEFGTESEWSLRIGEQIVAQGHAALWKGVTRLASL